MSYHGKLSYSAGTKIHVPDYALSALKLLEEAGYEAWFVGGFVRDRLMNRTISDVDIASSALWQDVKRIFEAAGYRCHETGTAHGTITVVVDEHPIEITTFRSDGTYSDGRHPDEVTFTRSIEEDLRRRDFTMNAMAYNPRLGLFDPFDGRSDIHKRIIRTVGNARERFGEDGLRILRACRFASQLGFEFDENTYSAMFICKSYLLKISNERVTRELELLLLGGHVHYAIMRCIDVIDVVLPELRAMKGFDQRTPYHIYDVLEHSAYVVQNTPAYPLVRFAALFHDAGKPATFFYDETGQGHFYGHALLSVRLAEAAMTRMTLPSEFKEKVLVLVRYHDDIIAPEPKAVKRMLMRLGGDTELFCALCDLKRGDALSQAPRCRSRVKLADELLEVLDAVIASEEAFTLKKLAIDGNDVMALGVPKGPAIGKALDAALAAAVDEEIPNQAAALRAFVAQWWIDYRRKLDI